MAFSGEERGHKGFSLLSQQIAALTEEVVGVRVTAHQFRHITATILLARHGLLAASKLLGHRSTATTSQNYAWLDREDVLKAWNELLLEMETDSRFTEGGSTPRPRRSRRRQP